MAAEEEDSSCDIPEWVVTFGDMMSLLLTFFIMLVSMSEIKEQDRYQAMVDSMQRQFGYTLSAAAVMPGDYRPRNSTMVKLATMGRARRKDLMKGGDKVQAPVGDHPRVQIVRQGTKTAIGTVIYFDEESTELTEAHREVLRQQILVLEGKPQRIEVRGHTSRRPIQPQPERRDHWDLAYERCRNTVAFLTDVMHIDPERLRMSVAGRNEPTHIGTDPDLLKQNSRVEVYLLDEVVGDFVGTPQEREQRFDSP